MELLENKNYSETISNEFKSKSKKHSSECLTTSTQVELWQHLTAFLMELITCERHQN